MLLTEIPFAGRGWALTFLTVLCPSDRYDEESGIQRRKLTDRARQAILKIKGWLPDFDLVFVGDSNFAVLDSLAAVKDQVTMVSRFRLDAALYKRAAARKPRQIRHPHKKGARACRLCKPSRIKRRQNGSELLSSVGMGKQIGRSKSSAASVSGITSGKNSSRSAGAASRPAREV